MSAPGGNGGGANAKDEVPYADLAPFLKRIDQHIVWREEMRKTTTGEMKPTKVPYSPKPGVKVHADANYSIAPECWVSAASAVNAVTHRGYAGIGVVFGLVPGTDEFVWGVDLDNCFEPNGTPRAWAAPLIAALIATYIEWSPSRTGVKAFIRGKVAQRDAIAKAIGITGNSRTVLYAKGVGGEKDQKVEIYLAKRYFTETGWHYAGSVNDVARLSIKSLTAFSKLLPKKEKITATADDAPTSLDELASAVAAIPTDVTIGDLDARGVWLRVMMGVHHETKGSDEGFAIVRDWSAKSPEFDEVGLRKQWDHLVPDHDNPTTAGTIFHLAEQFGWERVRRVPANAKLFAGMTLDEVIDDICYVTKGDWWWSISRATALTEKGLNNALSGLSRRPLSWLGKNQPTSFTTWLRASRNVTTYARFVRRGGQPPICASALSAEDEVVNTWRPLPPVPEGILERVRRDGDRSIRPWLDIANDVCNGNKEQVEQLLDWSAFVVMELGSKPGWSVVFYSAIQGIGKDMFAYGLARALGVGNYTTIGRKPLEGAFTDYLEKRLIHVSDLQTTTRGSMNGSDVYNLLRQPTSNFPRTVSINIKHVPAYDADNLSAWIISTNDEAPIAIPHEDRRWFVVEGRDTKRDDAFYAATDAWLEAAETGDTIRAFLELRWESMSASRRATIRGIAPVTEAKTTMIDAGLSPVMSAIKTAIDDGVFPDLVQLKDILDHLHHLKLNDRLARNAPLPNPTVLGMWMKTKFRAVQVPVGKGPARLPDDKTVRVYALRRVETYASMTTREVGKLYIEQVKKAKLAAVAGGKY